MPNWLIAVLIVGAFAALVFFLKRYKKARAAAKGDPTTIRVKALKTTHKTPGGVQVKAESGTVVTQGNLEAIDRGIAESITRGGCIGYSKTGTQLLSDYIVCVFVSSENDSTGFPAYRLPAGQYRGTIYDKGGYILVSGQQWAAGTPYGNIIIVPAHPDSQNDHLATVAGYEVEHILHAWHNGDEYERTKTHSEGNGHPTIPACPGSFADIPVPVFCGGASITPVE